VDVEHAIISEIVYDEDMGAAAEARLTPDYFTDDNHRLVFELITDHWLTHGKVPGEDVIHSAYPRYELGEYEEPLAYYVEQIRDRRMLRLLVDGIQSRDDLLDALSGKGPHPGQLAYEELASLLIEARMEVPVGKDDDLLSKARSEIFDIMAERKIGGLRGITTGFNEIDRATGGLQKEQLITLIGLPGTGKSSMLLRLALTAVQSGARIVFVTFEMSNEEQMDRAVSLVSGVDLNSILTGKVTSREKEQIADALNRLQGFDGFFRAVYDRSSMTTLSGLQAKIGEYSPSAVFVDGVYMMEDETGEPQGSPRALTNITRGLKRLAQNRKVPIICSTQALEQKSKAGVGMHSAGYTSSFAQDSDVIFALNQCPEPNPDVTKFSAVKVRNGPKTDAYVKMNWKQGSIDRVDPALIGLNLDDEEDDGPTLQGVS
jgi:replicative DNA helicase